MNNEIRVIEPSSLWNNFTDLNSVPRPSKREEKVVYFLIQFAEKLNLNCFQDSIGNLIINKPSQAVVFKSRRMGITNVPMQRALREGKYELALEIYKKTGFFCHFLTTKFGHEKPGYQSRHFGI